MAIQPSTLDVLDKDLFNEFSQISAGHPDTIFATYNRTVHINPFSWVKYYDEVREVIFTWKELKYQDIIDKKLNIDTHVDNEIGVYLIVIKPDNLIAGLPQYVVYVGIAGEHGSDRTLRQRLSDYFGLPSLKKRRNIHSLLYQYYKNIYILFSTLDVTPVELSKIEQSLHGYFHPPASDRDFPLRSRNKENQLGNEHKTKNVLAMPKRHTW